MPWRIGEMRQLRIHLFSRKIRDSFIKCHMGIATLKEGPQLIAYLYILVHIKEPHSSALSVIDAPGNYCMSCILAGSCSKRRTSCYKDKLFGLHFLYERHPYLDGTP